MKGRESEPPLPPLGVTAAETLGAIGDLRELTAAVFNGRSSHLQVMCSLQTLRCVLFNMRIVLNDWNKAALGPEGLGSGALFLATPRMCQAKVYSMPHYTGFFDLALTSLPHPLHSLRAHETPGQTASRVFKGIFEYGSILPVSLPSETGAAQERSVGPALPRISVQGLQPHLTKHLQCGQGQEF